MGSVEELFGSVVLTGSRLAGLLLVDGFYMSGFSFQYYVVFDRVLVFMKAFFQGLRVPQGAGHLEIDFRPVFQAHLSHPYVLQLFGYFWDRSSGAGSDRCPCFSFLRRKPAPIRGSTWVLGFAAFEECL